MGNSSSTEKKKWKHGIESEMRKAREERENDRQAHQEEMRKKEREIEKMNHDLAMLDKNHRMRSKLTKTTPGDSGNFAKGVHFPNRLLISLFGETGTGKTSLINSLKYAINGRLMDTQRIQTAHEEYHGAYTMESLEVVLTDHLSVIDNRGINSEKAANTALQEDVIRQMGKLTEKPKYNIRYILLRLFFR